MLKKYTFLALTLIASISLAACGNTADNQGQEQTNNAAKTEQPASPDTKEEPTNNAETSVYFTANEGGSISKIDATTNEVIDTIKVEGSVHNVQISPDGKVLGAVLVPNMGKGEHGGHGSMKMNGFALFYDVKTNELLKKVDVGAHPAHIVFTGNNKYALVSNNEDNSVSVIDLASYQVTQSISTGKGPHGFRISADSKNAYIANMGEDTVSVIDLETMKETKKIKVGQTPVTTGVTSDGTTLVSTLNSENSLAIVDLATDQTEKIQVGEGPAQVYIQSDDKYAFVANQGTAEKPSNSVSKVDLETKKVVATIEVGKGAHGIVTSDDNQFVYVTNMFDNTVSVIDNKDNKVIATINVGEVPNGISIR